MFGYVIANWGELSEQQRRRYHDCYCGLCRQLKADFSSVSRISLNYDMTFLLLLLNSLYEPQEQAGKERCIAHWNKRHAFWCSPATGYCAAMNVELAYFNALDDWHDEHNPARLALSSLLKPGADRAKIRYPRQSSAIRDCLRQLSALEASGRPDPDGAANGFGRLMGELFVWKEDFWAPTLRAMGQALGRFVYMMDAVCDLKSDLAHRRYNPLSGLAADGKTPADFQDDLTILIGECTAEFEKLPLIQDAELMRNILYSGVWTQYLRTLAKDNRSKEGSI